MSNAPKSDYKKRDEIPKRMLPTPHKPHKSPASSKKRAASKPKVLELAPDAWPRFEALVKSAAKMGHKPHHKIVPPKKATSGTAAKDRPGTK